MKSAALVLGLALAANAQVDNELATSLPYNPSGADLVRNAGWGRHLPIPTRSTFTRFDEAADDELLVNLWSPSGADLANHRGRPDTDKYGRPYTDMRGNPLGRPVYRDDEFMSLSGADLVKYAKQSQSTTYRPVAHVVRDDEADDELLVNLWSPSGADLANHRGRPDTDKYGRPYTDMRGNPLGRPVYRDDEFMSLSGADLVKYAKQSQQTVYRPTAHVLRDDADDELAAFPSHPSGADLVRNAGWGRSLPIHTPPKHTNPIYWSKNDDVADDELVQTFYSPSGADLVKYAKQSQQTVYRPTAHVVRDDAADDELATSPYTPYNPSGADLVRNAGWGRHLPIPTRSTFTRFDEATDDELAYLGHLIKETQTEKVEKKTHEKPEIRRKFRPVEKN